MATKDLVALSPLVIVHDTEGKDMYLYEGTSVPESADEADVERLIDLGMIGAKDEPKAGKPKAGEPAAPEPKDS